MTEEQIKFLYKQMVENSNIPLSDFDKELIKQHIINMLGQMESLSRQEITECVQRMLPASYDGDKVYNFITSLIREMSKKDGSIYNCVQSKKDARWKLK